MHIVLMCRSLTSAQKAARIIQNHGVFAVVTKAPQHLNSGGCGYGVKIAERNRAAALEVLASAGIEILQIAELPETGERGGGR